MTEYISALLHYARFESTPGGVCGATFEDCAAAVQSARESYVLWAIQTAQLLPDVDGVAAPTLESADALAR